LRRFFGTQATSWNSPYGGVSAADPTANTDRPDANYRPARQKSVNPSDLPEGYYEDSEPPLRTLVLRRIRRIVGAIRPSRDT
jgi:hypothetical protein